MVISSPYWSTWIVMIVKKRQGTYPPDWGQDGGSPLTRAFGEMRLLGSSHYLTLAHLAAVNCSLAGLRASLSQSIISWFIINLTRHLIWKNKLCLFWTLLIRYFIENVKTLSCSLRPLLWHVFVQKSWTGAYQIGSRNQKLFAQSDIYSLELSWHKVLYSPDKNIFKVKKKKKADVLSYLDASPHRLDRWMMDAMRCSKRIRL